VGLKDELSADILRVLQQKTDADRSTATSGNSALNGAQLEATLLYANLSPTKTATANQQKIAGKTLQVFLRCMAKLIITQGGTLAGFSGTKAVGVFTGDMRNTNAASCALRMNYVTRKMIEPKIKEYATALGETEFVFSHCVGIDTGPVTAVRLGLSGFNDLVWVGKAPAFAAALSETQTPPYHIYISEYVFLMLFEQAKFSPDRQLMWEETQISHHDEPTRVYRSAWYWEP
jgi:adenylate cyclase